MNHNATRRLLSRGTAVIFSALLLVAWVAGTLLAFGTSSPAKAATISVPHPGPAVPAPAVPVQLRTLVAGGMPGWQIALIAAGAAILAAILAVAADRARAARRHASAPSL